MNVLPCGERRSDSMLFEQDICQLQKCHPVNSRFILLCLAQREADSSARGEGVVIFRSEREWVKEGRQGEERKEK